MFLKGKRGAIITVYVPEIHRSAKAFNDVAIQTAQEGDKGHLLTRREVAMRMTALI